MLVYLLLSFFTFLECVKSEGNENGKGKGNGKGNGNGNGNGNGVANGRWRNSRRFPNAVTREVGRSGFNGRFRFREDQALSSDDVRSPPRRYESRPSELKEELVFRDVFPDGTEYETTLSDEDIAMLVRDAQERGMSDDRGEVSQCESDLCAGAEEEEVEMGGKDPESRRLMRRLRILGSDDRYEVKGNPISWSPSKHTGLLTFSGGSCSAALIGPRHILTAGHCVHEGDGGDWYSNFRFYPGRNSLYTPPSYGWSRARTFTGWTNSGSWDWDIAIIELSSSPNIGWVSFGWSNGLNDDDYFYHKGYSGDKPWGSMWSTSDYLWDTTTHQLRTDSSDTMPGNSGGPWYKYISIGPRIYAAHSGWGTNWYFKKYNRHTRITSGKFNSFCDFINDCSVCC